MNEIRNRGATPKQVGRINKKIKTRNTPAFAAGPNPYFIFAVEEVNLASTQKKSPSRHHKRLAWHFTHLLYHWLFS